MEIGWRDLNQVRLLYHFRQNYCIAPQTEFKYLKTPPEIYFYYSAPFFLSFQKPYLKWWTPLHMNENLNFYWNCQNKNKPNTLIINVCILKGIGEDLLDLFNFSNLVQNAEMTPLTRWLYLAMRSFFRGSI